MRARQKHPMPAFRCRLFGTFPLRSDLMVFYRADSAEARPGPGALTESRSACDHEFHFDQHRPPAQIIHFLPRRPGSVARGVVVEGKPGRSGARRPRTR